MAGYLTANKKRDELFGGQFPIEKSPLFNNQLPIERSPLFNNQLPNGTPIPDPTPKPGKANINPNLVARGGGNPFFEAFPGILPNVQRGDPMVWGRDTGAPGPQIDTPIPTGPTVSNRVGMNPWERKGYIASRPVDTWVEPLPGGLHGPDLKTSRMFNTDDLVNMYGPSARSTLSDAENSAIIRNNAAPSGGYTPAGGWGNTASSPTYQPGAGVLEDPLMGALMDKIGTLESRLARGSVDARGGSRPALKSDREMYNHLIGIAGALSGNRMRAGADVFGDVTRANAMMRGQDLTYDAQMQDLMSKAGVNAAHANLMGAQGELFRREAAGMPLDFQQKTGARIAELIAGQQPTTHSVVPMYSGALQAAGHIAGQGMGEEQTRKALAEYWKGAVPIIRAGVGAETKAAMMGNRRIDAAALGRYVSSPHSRFFDSIVLPENITTESQAFDHLTKLGLNPHAAMDWIKVRGGE
jgi:hypothetical protein